MAKEKTINVEAQANIYGKIMNIQQDIHTVIKSGFNDFHQYKFAKERDVIAEIKPLLGREGIAITHTVESESEVERTNSKGEKYYITKLIVVFRLTNTEHQDDFIIAKALGYGEDKGDKGAPKAYTMALKYMLSKMFLIETGDDAEQDKGKGGKGAEGGEDKFDKAKRMINDSRNIDGLLEYVENLDKKSTFTVAQKNQLKTAVKTRVDALSAK